MQRGDVVRVQLLRPQGTPGREQFGIRPAIVIQSNDAIANLATVVIIPLTSNASARRFDGSFVVHVDGGNGLTVDSVALTLQVRAIDRARIHGVIGKLSEDDLKELEMDLRDILGL